MGQARFLSEVHERVRDAAEAGAILDVYRFADELMARDLSYVITRKQAVDTVIAAGVVYGASLLIDPEDSGQRAANRPDEAAEADPAPMLLSA